MSGVIDIRRIDAEATIDLRHRVMWPDKPRTSVVLDGDADAIHYGAFLGDTLVGVGSFFQDGATVQLRKLAVDEAVQGRGIASKLLDVACQDMRAGGCHDIWCDARVSAIPFYACNGFRVDGKPFQKQGFDYVIARRAL